MLTKAFILLNILVLSVFNLNAEDQPLNIFTSMQSLFSAEQSTHKGTNISTGKKTKIVTETSRFVFQQLDIFMSKSFADRYHAFVDLEYYNMKQAQEEVSDNMGDFSIQEAWVSFDYADYLKLKGGWLFPQFNNMNAVKNRLILMPYILRPMVYEKVFTDDKTMADYIPQNANFQLSGFLPFHSLRFDYSYFLGNSEEEDRSMNTDFITDSLGNIKSKENNQVLGTLITGFRLGLRTSDESFRFGISTTSDSDFKSDSIENSKGERNLYNFKTSRYRVGLDLGIELYNFELDFEAITIFYLHSKYGEIEVNGIEVDMGQSFLYSTLLYNITDDFFLYTTFQWRNDQYLGLDETCEYIGGGYRINNNITAKIQAFSFENNSFLSNDYPKMNHTLSAVMLGISAFF